MPARLPVLPPPLHSPPTMLTPRLLAARRCAARPRCCTVLHCTVLQEVRYNADFQLVAAERRVARAEGHRSRDETAAMSARIRELEAALEVRQGPRWGGCSGHPQLLPVAAECPSQ